TFEGVAAYKGHERTYQGLHRHPQLRRSTPRIFPLRIAKMADGSSAFAGRPPPVLPLEGKARRAARAMKRPAPTMRRVLPSTMNRSAAEVLEAALALPEDQRATVAEKLLASLDSDVDADSETAW